MRARRGACRGLRELANLAEPDCASVPRAGFSRHCTGRFLRLQGSAQDALGIPGTGPHGSSARPRTSCRRKACLSPSAPPLDDASRRLRRTPPMPARRGSEALIEDPAWTAGTRTPSLSSWAGCRAVSLPAGRRLPCRRRREERLHATGTDARSAPGAPSRAVSPGPAGVGLRPGRRRASTGSRGRMRSRSRAASSRIPRDRAMGGPSGPARSAGARSARRPRARGDGFPRFRAEAPSGSPDARRGLKSDRPRPRSGKPVSAGRRDRRPGMADGARARPGGAEAAGRSQAKPALVGRPSFLSVITTGQMPVKDA